MSDSEKWDIAFSHFTHFVQNLPVMLDEDDVEQYHDIVGLFEDALRAELSRFKIPADRIKRPVQNPAPCWQTRLPARVDRSYFVGQVWDFAQYLKQGFLPTIN